MQKQTGFGFFLFQLPAHMLSACVAKALFMFKSFKLAFINVSLLQSIFLLNNQLY